MRINWQIDPEDIAKVHAFANLHRHSPFVKRRIERNLGSQKPPIPRARFWKAMVCCLLTTQQRSGPSSPAARFSRLDPFPLSYEKCLAERGLRTFAEKVLTDFGGLRRTKIVPKEMEKNLQHLEKGLWSHTTEVIDRLRENDKPQVERWAAEFIDDRFAGFGPKQSRNLLQLLGLTKYEIPIDSRITRWLNGFGFPVGLSATPLSDKAYYNFVSDGIQELCSHCNIYPTILDAVIFASFDRGEWREEDIVW